MNLVDRVSTLMSSLTSGGISCALGGALALAYATEEPRGTRDIDINVFVPSDEVDRVFASLPTGVSHSEADRRAVKRDDQVRLWWDDTPVDLFFSFSEFQLQVAKRCVSVPFAGKRVKVLCAEDLAVFKAMFDRSRDWVDIDEMASSGSLNRRVAARRLSSIIGADDARVSRLAGTSS